MFDHPFDNLGVAFSESGHEAGDLPVVLRVDVGSGRVEKLNDLEVTSICGQPQTGVALLVSDINLESQYRHKLFECFKLKYDSILYNFLESFYSLFLKAISFNNVR
jgi:hypothetical protein